MSIDYVDTLEKIYSDVGQWSSKFAEELSDVGVLVLDSLCVVGHEEKCGIIVLRPKEFLEYCNQNKKSTAFALNTRSSVDEDIELYNSRACDADDDLRQSIELFNSKYSAIKTKTLDTCPCWRRSEIFVIDNGLIVLTGVVSEVYEEFLDSLTEFSEQLNADKEEALIAQIESCEKVLEVLAEKLIEDQEFRSIRGKRKRCLYVENKYGDRIPDSTYLKRVDANSNPMNSHLVGLVERVSDRIEIGSSLRLDTVQPRHLT
jgi:hypothetical protein